MCFMGLNWRNHDHWIQEGTPARSIQNLHLHHCTLFQSLEIVKMFVKCGFLPGWLLHFGASFSSRI